MLTRYQVNKVESIWYVVTRFQPKPGCLAIDAGHLLYSYESQIVPKNKVWREIVDYSARDGRKRSKRYRLENFDPKKDSERHRVAPGRRERVRMLSRSQTIDGRVATQQLHCYCVALKHPDRKMIENPLAISCDRDVTRLELEEIAREVFPDDDWGEFGLWLRERFFVAKRWAILRSR